MVALSETMFICAFLVASRIARSTDTDDGNPSHKVEQDKEYFRYLRKVIHILEEDPEFERRSKLNATKKELGSGVLIEGLMPLLSEGTVSKLNQLKADEIKYQERLLEDEKNHMVEVSGNEWNPIHHGDKERKDFTQTDLTQLLHKFNNLQDPIDIKRKEIFKKYEINKEINFRNDLKNLNDPERQEALKKHEEQKHKKHEKMHAPGHKEELKEVWKEQDGLDPDDFDEKTFFQLHDKDSDGYLDKYELETMFLSDLDKVYNVSDPNTDMNEREEEMERMREEVMKEMDIDNDGLVSLKEYMVETESEDFEKDDEWEALTDKDQYTEEELHDS